MDIKITFVDLRTDPEVYLEICRYDVVETEFIGAVFEKLQLADLKDPLLQAVVDFQCGGTGDSLAE